jgi:hypothetical protein
MPKNTSTNMRYETRHTKKVRYERYRSGLKHVNDFLTLNINNPAVARIGMAVWQEGTAIEYLTEKELNEFAKTVERDEGVESTGNISLDTLDQLMNLADEVAGEEKSVLSRLIHRRFYPEIMAHDYREAGMDW